MTRKILVIEDDPDVREALSEVLADAGYAVTWATDGSEGMDLLRAGFRPDAILLDLMMPRMDGFEFRAAQRADPELADIPVIIVSADRRIEEEAEELHAAGQVAKPAAIDDVLAAVSHVAGP